MGNAVLIFITFIPFVKYYCLTFNYTALCGLVLLADVSSTLGAMNFISTQPI